jgi:hypothetical protein
MKETLLRFVIGGAVVSAFTILGDLFKPKSFAGLFGAATLSCAGYAGTEGGERRQVVGGDGARSMIAGAIAFLIYASLSWLMRYKGKALAIATSSNLVWLGTAFGLWSVWLR